MTTPVALELSDADLTRIGTDIQRRIGVKTSRHEPLARFTTMRVGGPADLFAEIHNLFELRAIVRFARARELPLFILGRGSDLVISDKGMRGLVVYNRAEGHKVDGNRLTADSGLPMAKAATLCKNAGLSGLEFGLAIPGTIGGAVWANAGAHESDVRAVIVEAGVLRADGEVTLSR
ncbi:MAG TPA: FAD-binding protein, partial [Candidatus Limnocylindrales bacterium]